MNLPLGFRYSATYAGIRKLSKDDLALIVSDTPASAAAVFTKNLVVAAPVEIARRNLRAARGKVRACLINAGNANCATRTGELVAIECVRSTAQALGVQPHEVLPASTGVIGVEMNADLVTKAMAQLAAGLRADRFGDVSQAIMTTDTLPKAASTRVELDSGVVTITGIAKGAGMIHPDMATMLGFIATDANLPQALMEQALREAADQSFNAITVDGDTSTNDSLILIATGRSGADEIIDVTSPSYAKFRDALTDVAQRLAHAIIRDGEGATKFITVRVEQGASVDECRKVAFAIAHSPLVKTAFFASDPNLGRILAAIGYAGIHDLNVDHVDLYLDDVLVAQRGGRSLSYAEADGQRVMQQPEITVRVVLNRGAENATVWTCDLSHEYVTINAEYRT